MPAETRSVATAKQQPSESNRDLQSLLGPPPLLEGEDPTAYEELWRRMRSAVAPVDVIEEFWVRDYVDLLWETMRLRRLKAALMRAAAHEGLAKVLTPLVPNMLDRNDLVRAWASRGREARQKVTGLLKGAGQDEAAIAAQTFAAKLDTFERMDRLIAQAEARRNTVLREVERRREAVARRLRDASEMIEDAEFTEIDGDER